MIIGVDESGTGAWAGPYTVTALAAYVHESDLLRKAGGTDSKKMTDINRRAAINAISEIALFAHTSFVSVAVLDLHKKTAWRNAVVASVTHVAACLQGRGIPMTSVSVVIDGLCDWRTERRITDELKITQVRFLTGAEDQVPAVGAASVFAKTERNDAMRELHETYPVYGWGKNFGYGTQEHKEAILRYGRSPEHRDIKVEVLGWSKRTP